MRIFAKGIRANPQRRMVGSRGFPEGLQQLSHPSALKDTELAEARNVEYQVNGVLAKRQGSTILGTSNGNKINALAATYKINGNNYFIRISDTGIAQYYNENTFVWGNITNSPTFSNVYTNIIQAYGRVYFLNEVDPMTYWDGNSWTIFTPINNPTTAPLAEKTGSGTGSRTLYYAYAWYNDVGGTIVSPERSIGNLPQVLDNSTYVTLTLPEAPAGARYTGIFRGNLPGEEIYMTKIPASQLSYLDKAQDEKYFDDNYLPPEANTTAGFHFKFADIYHNTLIGVTTEEGPDTLVFSAGADKFHSFGRPDGGGFYSWWKGSGSDITAVRAFTLSNEDGLYVTKRDRIGVFRFIDTYGSVRDINLGVGIVSHLSLHAAGNNLRGWGEDGAVSIQNEANYANIIRTQIFSIKADTLARSVTSSDLGKISGAYFDYKSFFGLPTGPTGTGNNTCLVYDERFKTWSEWRGITPAVFSTFISKDNKKRLYFGDSVSGNVIEMFKGKSDHGLPVVFKITTKQFDNGKPYAYKKYRRIIYIFGNVTGMSTTIRLFEDGVRALIPLSLNASTGDTGFGVDQWGTVQFGTSTGTFTADTSGLIVRYANLNNRDLFSIQTTIENDGLNDEISVVGTFIELSDSNKPLKSTAKLQKQTD